MRNASILVTSFLLGGCLASTTHNGPSTPAHEVGTTGFDAALPPVLKIHVQARGPMPEFGFRIAYNLTSSGTCEWHQVARWKIAPDDERPYHFLEFLTPNAKAVGTFVGRPIAQAHVAGGPDTREVLPSPWFNVVPLQLDGEYQSDGRMQVGGRFASNPHTFTAATRNLVPGPDGLSYRFDLTCTVPFQVLLLESIHDVQFFSMSSLANGGGHSLSGHGSENKGDWLEGSSDEPRVRLIAHDSSGVGEIRLKFAAESQSIPLPARLGTVHGEGGPGNYRLEVDRKGSGREDYFQGFVGGFRPQPDVPSLSSRP